MKEGIKLDANRLIAEVHKRPALWNQRHILYHNREVTNRIWTELSLLMKLPKLLLKSKWKGLRDTYRSEIKKEQVFQKTKSARSRSTWIHYKTLRFLKDQMLPRPPIWDRPSKNNEAQNSKNPPENHDDDNFKSEESETEIQGSSPTDKQKSSRSGTANSMRIIFSKNNSQPSQRTRNSSTNKRTENKKLEELNNGSCRRNKRTEMTKILKPQLVFSHSGEVLGTTYQVAGSLNDQVVSENESGTFLESIDNTEQNVIDCEFIKPEPPDNDSVCDSLDFRNSSGKLINGTEDHGEEMLQNVSPEQVLLSSGNSTVFNSHEANKLDDNYYFLMSLLPHIRKLSGEGRMLLRMRMQELVYKEVYKKL